MSDPTEPLIFDRRLVVSSSQWRVTGESVPFWQRRILRELADAAAGSGYLIQNPVRWRCFVSAFDSATEVSGDVVEYALDSPHAQELMSPKNTGYWTLRLHASALGVPVQHEDEVD